VLHLLYYIHAAYRGSLLHHDKLFCITLLSSYRQHVLLKDVTPESVQRTLKVRAVRFCEYLNNETPRVALRMDQVL
jgi:hypothetical protein